MEHKAVKILIGAVALTGSAIAGPISGPIEAVGTPSQGDFCETFKNMGKLYKNSDNPFIQEFKVFGRTHFTYAHVEAEDASGNTESKDFTEFRRVRAGMYLKAFNRIELFSTANLIDDRKPSGGPRVFGYEQIDETYIRYNFGTVAGIENFKLSYGRFKVAVGAEGQQSSKTIKTVERAAISNRVFTNRYTALLASGKRGNIDGTVGFLSLDGDSFIGNWDDGNAIYADATVTLGGHDYLFDALYNLDEDTAKDDVGMDFLFAASAATERKIAGWDVLFNIIYGDNGDDGGAETGGAFWGAVIMPSRFIIEDKLEAVFRYQYQGSDKEEGISTNSRYIGDTISGVTGDQHQSIYAGLNYFFCGHNSKLMVGAEYDNIQTPTGTADGTTLWAAYRVFF